MRRTEYRITWGKSFIKASIEKCLKEGWHPSDHGLRRHAIFCLALDHVANAGLWPCHIQVNDKENSATITKQ